MAPQWKKGAERFQGLEERPTILFVFEDCWGDSSHKDSAGMQRAVRRSPILGDQSALLPQAPDAEDRVAWMAAALATSLAMLGWTPGGQRGGMSIHHSFHVI